MGGRKSDVAVAISSPADLRRSMRKRNLVEESDQGISFDEPPLKKSAGKRRLVESNDMPDVLNPRLMTKQRPSVDRTGDDEVEVSKPKKQVQKKPKTPKAEGKAGTDPAEEKRLKRWRKKAPNSHIKVYERAMTQRMFVIDRIRGGDAECPEETLTIAGTTGNLYTIKIAKEPSCDCPYAKKGNQCKHIVYAMCRVLHAPEHLQYQLALLPSELRTIFASAPPIPSADASRSTDATAGTRKPVSADDDCPICCMAFEPDADDIAWCRAACGNNVHCECFAQWAATKRAQRAAVTCPFCRTPWQEDDGDVRRLAAEGDVNADGYVNVAVQLGLSGRRDYSSYHPFWVQQQYRAGVDVGGEIHGGRFYSYEEYED